MSEGDGDIEDGLQRQGEERDTRFDAGAEGESEPAAMDDLEALVGDKRTGAEVGLLDRRRRAGSEEPAEDRHVRARLSVDSSKG